MPQARPSPPLGPSSASPLWKAVYSELRALAASQMKQERPDHTLQPTALIHEAFLRLRHQRKLDLSDPEQVLAVAANVFRRILVDHARRRNRRKRGQGFTRIALDEELEPCWPRDLDALALDEALTELEELSERQARIVELRFFANMSLEETARALDVSVGTVKNDWRFARAWLSQRLDCG